MINREYWIDYLRALAAFFVVIQHVFEEYFFGFKVFSSDVFNPGVTGVVLFFFVSGYVIPLSCHNKSFLKYCLSRVLRIFPLLWIVLLVIVVLSNLNFLDREFNLLSFILNLFLVNEFFGKAYLLGVTWTLSIEIFWYILIGCYFFFFRNKISANWLLLLSTSFFIFLSVASIYLELRLPLGRGLLVLVAMLGYYLYVQGSPLASNISAFVTLCCILSVFLGLWTSFIYYEHATLNGKAVLVSWGGAFFVFYMAFYFRKYMFFKFFQVIGLISYSTYLIHPVIRDLVLGLNFDIEYAISFTLIVIYLFSYFLYFSLESKISIFNRKVMKFVK